MTNDEKELVRIELEKCLRKQELKFELRRTMTEKEYSKKIHISINEEPLDLMSIIKRRERLLRDSSCYIILNNHKFDFTSEEIQIIWYSTYKKIDEELYLEKKLGEEGLL